MLKGVLTRALGTGVLGSIASTSGGSNGDEPGVAKLCAVVREVMDRDYAGVIKMQLEDVYASSGQGAGAKAGGGIVGAVASKVGGDKAEREMKVAFMVRSFLYSFVPLRSVAHNSPHF